jgi:ATP-dependent Clp protease ATP-binding subunit ClpC
LSEREIEKIVELEFANVQNRIVANGFSATLTESAKKYIAKEGYDPQFGARPLKRVMKRALTDRLANLILAGNMVLGDKIVIDAGPGELTFRTEAGVADKAV